MLELRPNCEYCDKDLPPDSPEAMICSYECTFCTECVQRKLENVCPNCGGGFVQRPIRPREARRPGVSLEHHPAGTERRHLSWSKSDIRDLVQRTRSIPPALR